MTGMIRTVTLNTGFDETFVVSEAKYGGVSDIVEQWVQPSGKGVNAALGLRVLSVPVHVYGFVGREDLAGFKECLGREGADATLVELDSRTRRNLTLLSLAENAPAAHFRGRGFQVEGEAEVEELVSRLEVDCEGGDVVSLHGSTPEGAAVGTWGRFARVAWRRGARVAVDVYGEALLEVLDACEIDVCKPNEEEMRVLPGASSGATEEAARAALRYMVSRGVRLPIVSLGAEGVVFAGEGRLYSASAPVSRARVLVGAGDAFMAGVLASLAGREMGSSESVACGVAMASAHVEGLRGTMLADRWRQLLGSVQVRDLGAL